jgi:hypothetical protein
VIEMADNNQVFLSDPPHKPPWFPEGDPLDPINSELPTKLPQRYTGDTHQTYDVITSYIYHYSPSEYWKLLPCDKYFVSPLYPLDKGFDNGVNGFFLFERYAPGLSSFVANYVDKVYKLLRQLKEVERTDLPIEFLTKDKYWDTDFLPNNDGNLEPVVNGKGNFLGDSVSLPSPTQIEVEEPTTIQFVWFELDEDNSYKLNSAIYKGDSKITFDWQPNNQGDNESDVGKVLPWSGLVILIEGQDITGEIKSQLPKELLADNENFPDIDSKDDKGNNFPQKSDDDNKDEIIKLLLSQFDQNTRTQNTTATIEPWFTDDYCCPNGTVHLWTTKNYCQNTEEIIGFVESLGGEEGKFGAGQCNASNAGLYLDSCYSDDFVEVSNWDGTSASVNNIVYRDYDGDKFPFPNYSIFVGDYSGKKWVDRKQLETDTQFNEVLNEDYITFNLDNPYSEEHDGYEPVTQFVSLSRANHNYWSIQDNGTDRGETIKLFRDSEIQEIKIQNTFFMVESDDNNFPPPPNKPFPRPFNECDYNFEEKIQAQNTNTVTLRGRQIAYGFDPIYFRAFTEDSNCENGWAQATRQEDYISYEVRTYTTTRNCTIYYPDRDGDGNPENYPPFIVALNKNSAIAVIDSHWYAFFYPNGASDFAELVNS